MKQVSAASSILPEKSSTIYSLLTRVFFTPYKRLGYSLCHEILGYCSCSGLLWTSVLWNGPSSASQRTSPQDVAKCRCQRLDRQGLASHSFPWQKLCNSWQWKSMMILCEECQRRWWRPSTEGWFAARAWTPHREIALTPIGPAVSSQTLLNTRGRTNILQKYSSKAMYDEDYRAVGLRNGRASARHFTKLLGSHRVDALVHKIV